MKEKTRKLDDSTVYVIRSAGTKPIKMIIEEEIVSQPSNRDPIFQFISRLIDMEILFQLIMENYFATSASIMNQRRERADDGH